jgi:hypothetical protein
MDFGSVPGCGVGKDKSGLKAAAGVDFITAFISVSFGWWPGGAGRWPLTPWNRGLCRTH